LFASAAGSEHPSGVLVTCPAARALRLLITKSVPYCYGVSEDHLVIPASVARRNFYNAK
jgi:hypothetical protein